MAAHKAGAEVAQMQMVARRRAVPGTAGPGPEAFAGRVAGVRVLWVHRAWTHRARLRLVPHVPARTGPR